MTARRIARSRECITPELPAGALLIPLTASSDAPEPTRVYPSRLARPFLNSVAIWPRRARATNAERPAAC